MQLPLLTWSDVVAGLSAAGRRARAQASGARDLMWAWRIPAAQSPVQPRQAPATPIGIAGQWVRLVTYIVTTIERAYATGRMQAEAADQIDAADYAYELLLAELGGVMPLPARRAVSPVLARIVPAAPVQHPRRRSAAA